MNNKIPRIPGRTKEEQAFDSRILFMLAFTALDCCPADMGTWQENRWMEVLYYRKKWQLLCQYS